MKVIDSNNSQISSNIMRKIVNKNQETIYYNVNNVNVYLYIIIHYNDHKIKICS